MERLVISTNMLYIVHDFTPKEPIRLNSFTKFGVKRILAIRTSGLVHQGSYYMPVREGSKFYETQDNCQNAIIV